MSNFEKEIKKLIYSLRDETLKKYVMEDFLVKLKNLTPIQTSNERYKYSQFSTKKNIKILDETKILHQKRKDLSKIQILEFSILYVILNNFEIASKKIEKLSKIKLLSEKNESLKNEVLTLLSEQTDKKIIQQKINTEYKKLIEEIKENSNIQIITQDKTDEDILNMLDELIIDFKEQDNLKKIESLEKKLINNLDESSYSELIRLKNQINSE